MNDEPRDEPLSAAEERLLAYLLLLRVEAQEAGAPGAQSVMRTVRWQLMIRSVVRAVGDLAAAIADGVTALVGQRVVRR